jgi:hypothetical protein
MSIPGLNSDIGPPNRKNTLERASVDNAPTELDDKLQNVTEEKIIRPKLKFKSILSILITLLLFTIVLYPHIFQENDRSGKMVVMNFSELGSDWDSGANKFTSLSAGDILRIEDVILDMKVVDGQTHLSFNGALVIIDDNIIDEYDINDEVVIILTLSIYENVQYGYKFQWFEEDNDGVRGHLVIPPDSLYHLEDFESEVDKSSS